METNPAKVRGKTVFVSFWDKTILQSTTLTLSILFLGIFLAAFVAMTILHRIPAIPEELDIVADSVLVLLFLYPCLAFLLKRPYLHQIRERERTEAAFRDEPFVRDVVAKFDGRVRPDSIKPLPAGEEPKR